MRWFRKKQEDDQRVDSEPAGVRRRAEEFEEDGHNKTIVEEVDETGRKTTTVSEKPLATERRVAVAEKERDDSDSELVGEEEVVRSHANPWDFARGWIRTLGLLVGLALAVVETLLAFRLGFLVSEANPNNDFVNFIYDISGPMVEPFEDIASARSVNGGLFEPATAIAMGVYFIAAMVLIAVLWVITTGPSLGDRSVTQRHRWTRGLH